MTDEVATAEELVASVPTAEEKSDNDSRTHEDEDRATSVDAHAPTSDVTQSTNKGKRTALNRADLSEKKLRRLEKNRLSARECRRRKKEAAQQLEQEIQFLERENLRLRLQLKVHCRRTLLMIYDF